MNAWKPLTVTDLKKFLGLLFLAGLIWKPSLDMYWSVEEILSTPWFPRTMSRNCFQILWKFLHFSDNSNLNTTDQLRKVRPVLDTLLASFKEMYRPEQDVSIDEGTLLWRGRLRVKVCNPVKPIKYDINREVYEPN